MKRVLLLALMLVLCVPCAHASRLTESAILKFEDLADENFDIMCNYQEDGNVACMQMTYQRDYLEAYKLFHTDTGFKEAFDDVVAVFSSDFHIAATAFGDCSTSIVVVISSDNYPLAICVNGQNVDWMRTNWNGIKPFTIR